jgi:hypothetical protein
MLTVRFIGRVLPGTLELSLANRPAFNWTADELKLTMAFRVNIEKGAIEIDCDVNKFDPTFLVPLYARALDIARATVDLIAFATGSGLMVVLEEFVDPAGAVTPLLVQQPALAALGAAAKPGTPDFEKVLKFVLANRRVYVALRHLAEAISAPHRAAYHSRQAIRHLGPLFRSAADSPDRASLLLRENLQISPSYLQRLTLSSVASSDPVDQLGTTAVHCAWNVMNRLLEYLKRGGQPLPLSEFPLLV